MKAFPTHKEEGMELRDWFAGLVVQGLCGGDRWPGRSDQEYMAKYAYEMADLMMKAREQK